MKYYKKRKLHKIVSSYIEDVCILQHCTYNFCHGGEWLEGSYKHGQFKLFSSSFEVGFFLLRTYEHGDFDVVIGTTTTTLNRGEVLALLNA